LAQTVTDAVQNEKISTIDKRVGMLEAAVSSVAEKQTYQLGGIAGMYALLGIIGVFNIRVISKK
jgi:hypothetical protein